jgi:hypothetical protein
VSAGVSTVAQAKPFMDYIKPMPITCELSSASWGVAGVLPRDLCNGIEDAKGAGVPPGWYYWDGQIIRAKDGKYHLFHSTWEPGDVGFQRWTSSDAFHSVSETSVLGPYKRQDYVYTNNGSHKGHNVSAVELPDGSYAVVVGEIVPLTIYKSSSLDGPWTGCSPSSQVGASNVSLFPREDGRFEIVERNGNIAIADTLCGTYVKQKTTCDYSRDGDSIYPKRTSTPGVPNPTYDWQEDPHIFRSAGTYHVIYSGSGDRVGWHVYSADGINNWKDNGYAWSPREYQKIFCYEGGTTCNQWYKMERPGVVLQDGHPTHITWAVSDVDKDNQIPAGSNHGSKIIVVPFDGVAFDADFGNGTSGTGGSTGTGGSSATGGSSVVGGSSATGGSTGTGGATGIGGAGATGGNPGTGGRGRGGTTSTAGSGGDVMTGGASGRGGIGGTSASGGTTGGAVTGGNPGSGGSNASGGASGGTSSSASGGRGGSTSFGGLSASGGTVTGGGGSSSSASATGGSGGSASPGTAEPNAETSSGCGCVLVSASRNRAVVPALLLGALLFVRRRNRGRRNPG